jgi:hypothetical protein
MTMSVYLFGRRPLGLRFMARPMIPRDRGFFSAFTERVRDGTMP